MDRDDSRLEYEHDYRDFVTALQGVVSKARRKVALHQVKTPTDFIIVMDTLRLCGVSMADAGNELNVLPATVHNWQNGQQLPPASEYQQYAELAAELMRNHLILFGGRRWGLNSPVAQ